MKNLLTIVALTVLMSPSLKAQTSAVELRDYVCFTTDEPAFVDYFHIEVISTNKASVMHQRDSGFGPSAKLPLVGCESADIGYFLGHNPNVLTIICAGDGEEGSIDIYPPGDIGEVYFYKSKLGHSERTSLKLKCN
jgi:hypothetical protein